MQTVFNNDNNNFTLHTVRDLASITSVSFNCNQSLLIAHQNVRSLRQNFDVLVSNLNAFSRQPDLIFLSEIWIFSTEINDFTIPGYTFHAVTNDTYAAGGVGLFVKSHLNCHSISCDTRSADVMKTTLNVGKNVYCFFCIYRLHSIPVCSFLEEFDAMLSREKCRNLVIVGDMNLDLLSDCENINNYHCIIAKNGLFSFINEPTRPSSRTCIDHILGRFSAPQDLYSCFNLDLDISDHCMTGIALPTSINIPKNNSNKTFLKTDFDKLNNLLLHETWNEVYDVSDVSLSYNLFLKN